MIEPSIRGADQLGDLARALRAEGDSGKGLKRELLRALNRATKPLRAEAQKEALARLPKSGGLAAQVAKSRLTTKTMTGRNPGVSIQAKGDAARSTDRGTVTHPVFGNRDNWTTQSVRGGWFTDTMRDSADEVRKELTQAIDDVADRIKRS